MEEKKILTDEELDNVVGGYKASDMKFIKTRRYDYKYNDDAKLYYDTEVEIDGD